MTEGICSGAVVSESSTMCVCVCVCVCVWINIKVMCGNISDGSFQILPLNF